MKEYLSILNSMPLFKDIKSSLTPLLSCLSPVILDYHQDQTIWYEGEAVTQIGIVLTGKATISRVDSNGIGTIITQIAKGDLFGEAFVGAGLKHSLVTVTASTPAKVMFVGYERFLTFCPSNCVFHAKVVENLIQIIASKNLHLMEKLEVLSGRSIRERVLTYLHQQGSAQGGDHIVVPFNRTQLADYLSVDRSALSRELSNMQKEHLIDYNQNTFVLLDKVRECPNRRL